MLFAKVNGHRSIEIDVTGSPPLQDGKEFTIDVSKLPGDKFHIIRNNQGYHAEIMDVNSQTKTAMVRINGSVYTIQLRDKFDLLLEKLGMNNSVGTKLNNLKAPMPGLIIDLRVAEGQSIQPGDSLIILEAMKMENIIKASGGGMVKRVNVKKGDSVEKGQVLIEF